MTSRLDRNATLFEDPPHYCNKIRAFGGMVLKFEEKEKTVGFVLKPWVSSAILRILRVRRVKVFIDIY